MHAMFYQYIDVTPFNAAAAAADVDVGNFSISGRIINVKTMTAKKTKEFWIKTDQMLVVERE